MENATKFLIIAGAVLIAIVLISVGMTLVSSSSGAMSTATDQFSKQEIQMFNAQFTSYEGKQNGANVKSLIEAVISNNVQYQDTTNKLVSLVLDSNGTPAISTKYKAEDVVVFKEDSTSGVVTSTFDTSKTLKKFTTSATILKDYLSTGVKYKITFDKDLINGGLIYNIHIIEPGNENY